MRTLHSALVLLLLFPWCSHADTHACDPCSRAALVTLLADEAVTSGDTITIPAGTYDWSDGAVTVTKEVAIIGAGTGCPGGCGDETTLTLGSVDALVMEASNFRLSGLTFDGEGAGNIVLINKSGASVTGWRIDHCHFKDNGQSTHAIRSITVGTYASESGYYEDFPGLIDSNRFSGTYQNKSVELYGGSATDNGSWDDTLSLGSDDFLFIEGNAFDFSVYTTGVSTIDSDTGGRVVVRHNTMSEGWISAHGIEDSNISSYPWRSSHGWEIYCNKVSATGGDFAFYVRGGTGVIWGNEISGSYTLKIHYMYSRGDYEDYCLDDGACQGSSEHDGNTDGCYGYPCYQQVGMTGADGITPMPAYQWSNTYNGETDESTFSSVRYDSACNYQHIQFGRDVILNGTTPKSGYTPYTCPHPLTGLPGSCDPNVAGVAGYNVGIHTVTLGGGGTQTFTLGGAGTQTFTVAP